MDVIIDNCVIDLLAQERFDPIADLMNTEFTLVYTPDLKFEYQQAVESAQSPAARTLAKRILHKGVCEDSSAFQKKTAETTNLIWVGDKEYGLRRIRRK